MHTHTHTTKYEYDDKSSQVIKRVSISSGITPTMKSPFVMSV